jgi:hypothetical protein
LQLDLFVALKFLPTELSKDHQAVERFRREGQYFMVTNLLMEGQTPKDIWISGRFHLMSGLRVRQADCARL